MKISTLLGTSALLAILGLSGCSNAEMAAINEGIREGSQPNYNNDRSYGNRPYGNRSYGDRSYGNQSNGNGESMMEAQRSCKTYTSAKTGLPMAAVSAYSGYRNGNTITVPMRVKWTNPNVDEQGECKVVDGRAVSYTITD